MLKEVLVNIRDLARWKSTFEPEIDQSLDKRLRRIIAFGMDKIAPISADFKQEYEDHADLLDFTIIGDYLIETAAVSKVDESHLDEFTKKRFKKLIEDMTDENVISHLQSFESGGFIVPRTTEELNTYLVDAKMIAQTAFMLYRKDVPAYVYLHNYRGITLPLQSMNRVRS